MTRIGLLNRFEFMVCGAIVVGLGSGACGKVVKGTGSAGATDMETSRPADGGEGQGGSAGGGAQGDDRSCTAASECDDGDPCNGVESCKDNLCAPGSFSCGADPEHCRCVGQGDLCVVRALDKDSDGHLDALCAEAPGEDCDDSNDAVYPGAVELCDGADNDCDGLFDLDDGLPLSGGWQSFPAGAAPRIAWSPALRTFGIVSISGKGIVQFATMNTGGEPVLSQISVSQAAGEAPAIAWGAEGFGVAWIDSSTGHAMFRQIDADGEPSPLMTIAAEYTEQVELVAQEANGFLAAYGNFDGAVPVVRVSDGKSAIVEWPTFDAPNHKIGGIWSNEQNVWLSLSETDAVLARVSANLGAPATEKLPLGRVLLGAGTVDGFASAWDAGTLDEPSISFELVGASGTVCGPTTVSSATRGSLRRVVEYDEQFVTVAQDELMVWDQACRRLGNGKLTGSRSARDAAAGAGRLAVVSEYFSSTEVWLTGENLCQPR